jgi:hypothetical protein
MLQVSGCAAVSQNNFVLHLPTQKTATFAQMHIPMTPEAVLQFTLTHFSDSRQALVPLLLKRLQDRSSGLAICEALDELPILYQAYETGSDELDRNLMSGQVDLDHLGDVCDTFTILLNPEIEEMTDWDFRDIIQQDQEVHTIRLWVNWFIPVYYWHCEFTRGIQGGQRYQYGPLERMSAAAQATLAQVQKIMADLGYTAVGFPFLEQRFRELSTDLVEDDASLFECLFSDLTRPALKLVENDVWWK